MAKNSVGGNKKILLLLVDIAILYISLWITLLIRYQETVTAYLWNQHLMPFSVVFVAWLVIFYIDELYELDINQGMVNQFVRLVRGSLISAVIATSFFYFATNRLFTIRPQRVLIILLGVAIVLLFVWRLLFHHFARSPKIANSVLFIGFNELTAELIQKISSTPQLGFVVRGIVATNTTTIPQALQPLVINQSFSELKHVCVEHKISTIVSTINPREDKALMSSLFECLPLRISFFDLPAFYEKITGKIPVTNIGQMWFLENLTESTKSFYTRITRVLEVIVSIVALIIISPLLPIIALAIKFTSPGSAIFKQTRLGQNGKIFSIIKFRTMVVDAEKQGPQWATHNDQRVTSLGKFLRKVRLDEIPQFVNIIKGEMSLIGPRPERPEFIERLQQEIPFYKERLLVKPGATGWAQVVGPAYGGSVEESLEKLQYDLFYIKNRSLGLDLSIYLKTIKTILTRKGR